MCIVTSLTAKRAKFAYVAESSSELLFLISEWNVPCCKGLRISGRFASTPVCRGELACGTFALASPSQTHIFFNSPSSQRFSVFPDVASDYVLSGEAHVFWNCVLEKFDQNPPLTADTKPVHSASDQSWASGATDAEALFNNFLTA